MSQDNWKTIRVPEAAYKEAKQQKDKHDRTWGEQLTCGDTSTTEVVEASAIEGSITQAVELEATDYEQIAKAVARKLQ